MARSDALVALPKADLTDERRWVKTTTEAIVAKELQKRDMSLLHHLAYEFVSEPAAVSQA